MSIDPNKCFRVLCTDPCGGVVIAAGTVLFIGSLACRQPHLRARGGVTRIAAAMRRHTGSTVQSAVLLRSLSALTHPHYRPVDPAAAATDGSAARLSQHSRRFCDSVEYG